MAFGLCPSLVLIISVGLIFPGKVYSVAIAEGSGWDEGTAGFDPLLQTTQEPETTNIPTTIPPPPITTTRVATTRKGISWHYNTQFSLVYVV